MSPCLAAKLLASLISHVQHFPVPASQCVADGNRVYKNVSVFKMFSSFSGWPRGKGGALDKSPLQSRTTATVQSLTCVKRLFSPLRE